MNEWGVLTEHNWTFWIAGLFALLEFGRWLYSIKEFVFEKVGIKTKGMMKREEFENRLKKVETSIDEIKDTSKHNVNMFLDHEQQVVGKFTGIKDEIVSELNKLHGKMDEQQHIAEQNNKANTKTNRAMLRDRINSGMRYFSQNKDTDGNVHISIGDYENLEALFKEYFFWHGNGTFKKMYETEFKNFIIDR